MPERAVPDQLTGPGQVLGPGAHGRKHQPEDERDDDQESQANERQECLESVPKRVLDGSPNTVFVRRGVVPEPVEGGF